MKYTIQNEYALFRQSSEELISNANANQIVTAFVDINLADGVVYPSIRVIGEYDENDLILSGEGYEETLKGLNFETMPAIPELGETEETRTTVLETTFLLKESGFATVQLKGHTNLARISWVKTEDGFLLFDFEGHGIEVNHSSKIVSEILDPNLARSMIDNKNRIKSVKYAKTSEDRLAMLQHISRTHQRLVESIAVH